MAEQPSDDRPSTVPVGFDRATGVVENRRRCRSCGRLFPVTDDQREHACPYCHCAKSEAACRLPGPADGPSLHIVR